MCPDLQCDVELEMVGEYPASNGSVWKLEERLVVVRGWGLQVRRKIWNDQNLQTDPQATPRTWALPVSMWWLRSGTS